MSEETEIIETEPERTKVGFPEAPEEEPRKFNYMALIIVLLVLLLLGGGVWFLFFKKSADTEMVEEETPVPTVEQQSTPTPTVVEVNKEDIKIQILNGSGVPGAASKSQTALTAVGYKNIEVGNADSYTYKTTVVAYSDSVPESVKTEISAELEKIYGTIDTKPNTSTQYDVVITIGFPKNYTPSVTGRPKSASLTPTKAATSGTITPTGRLSTTVTPTP